MSSKRSILLVEGRDDREVVYQFCNHHSIDNRSLFDVMDKEGIDNLLDDLRVRIRSGIEVIGVLIDADTDLPARWHQIKEILSSHGYSLPSEPSKDGVIVSPTQIGRPVVGIWLMPDNQTSGILEDFLMRLAQEGDPLVERANQAVHSIPEEEKLFVDAKRSKAVIHTWLAWQPEPGTSLGLAITRSYLDPSRTPAPEFRQWLEDLFVRESASD